MSAAQRCPDGVQPDPAKLRELREGLDWSQQELADQLGCHVNTIRVAERGARTIWAHRALELMQS